MNEILKLITEVDQRLNNANISYMFSSSIALSVYAEPRFTNDIDLVIDVLPVQKNQLLRLFEDDFYISEAAVQEAFQGMGMFNIIHNRLMIKCDLILLQKDPYSVRAFARKRKEVIDGREFFFISLEDLIIRKNTLE